MLLLSLTLVQASVACMLTGLLLWGLLSQAARHGLRWRRYRSRRGRVRHGQQQAQPRHPPPQPA